MQLKNTTALVAGVLLLSACASIIEGSSDDVKINNISPVAMTCNATNERGSWIGQVPGQVTVKKSRTDLKLACQDPRTGAQAGATLVSEVEPWAFGNILLGGIIGLGVDWGTGAAYDYPDSVTVTTTAAPTAIYAPAPATVAPVAPVPAPAASIAPLPPVMPSNANVQYYAPATPVVVEPVPAAAITPMPFGSPTPPPSY